MNEQDAKYQMNRVTKFRELEAIRNEAYIAMHAIQGRHLPENETGPFTGNTRESRRVNRLAIFFTSTRGGASPVEMNLPALNIEACRLGQLLVIELEAKIKAINEEMEKI